MIRNKKLNELQVFSGLAIVFVVLIHSLSYYLTNILSLTAYTDAVFSIRFLQNIIFGAVPIFIFIAGYKYALNNINDEYKSHVIKKIRSVIKPFITVSMIMLVRNIIIYPESYSSSHSILLAIFKILIGINPAYQLWFIPMYIFISITYPLIYSTFKDDKMRVFIIALIVIAQRLLAGRFNILGIQPFNFIYYYLFYEMGLIFYKYNIKEKFKDYDIAIIITYIIATIGLSKVINPVLHKQIQLYLISILSITAFYFISIRLKDSRVLGYLGENSFFIYLFHEPIVLTYIATAFKNMGIYDSKVYIFIICLLSILGSLIIYKIIINSPLKYIFFNIKKSVNRAKV